MLGISGNMYIDYAVSESDLQHVQQLHAGQQLLNLAKPGALPAKWDESPSNTVETTKNAPIVDIMAITRGMCK